MAGRFGCVPENLQAGESFIDEIHRLNRSVGEILYPAMEDFVWIL